MAKSIETTASRLTVNQVKALNAIFTKVCKWIGTSAIGIRPAYMGQADDLRNTLVMKEYDGSVSTAQIPSSLCCQERISALLGNMMITAIDALNATDSKRDITRHGRYRSQAWLDKVAIKRRNNVIACLEKIPAKAGKDNRGYQLRDKLPDLASLMKIPQSVISGLPKRFTARVPEAKSAPSYGAICGTHKAFRLYASQLKALNGAKPYCPCCGKLAEYNKATQSYVDQILERQKAACGENATNKVKAKTRK